MRNTIVVTIAFLCFSTLFSQEGFKHVSMKGGYTYEGHGNFEIGLEFNRKYYNNWTIFFSGFTKYHGTNNEENNWTTGIYYAPSIVAVNNHLLNFKFGTSLGTNEDIFIMDLIAGMEYDYALNEWLKIGLFFKNNYLVVGDNDFRHALLGGIKIRL